MKKNIAIVTGGFSGEYSISIKSAQNVIKHINRKKYEPYLVEINKKAWTISINDKKYSIDKNDFSCRINEEKIIFDCVFIIIHGTPGEDGILQGYFDLLGIPYISSGVLTSALCFNKNACYNYLKQYCVFIPETVYLSHKNQIDIENILKVTRLPCFVKPNNGGSSIGVSKVYKKNELVPAVKKAFREDDEVLIQRFIEGKEITCGVFQKGDEAIALPLTEIVSKKDFFDYEAKYEPALSDEITPARVSNAIEKKCQELSVMIFNKLNCKGVARIDYILNNDNLYFLEINTIPGLTEVSIVPKQVKEMGLSLEKFFEILIKNVV